ncbi:MAG: HAMP domain-containing protein, partial [Actinobacteria bacterium]|nr:HAMP domain-containing protein [Actinomycetota bacterium]
MRRRLPALPIWLKLGLAFLAVAAMAVGGVSLAVQVGVGQVLDAYERRDLAERASTGDQTLARWRDTMVLHANDYGHWDEFWSWMAAPDTQWWATNVSDWLPNQFGYPYVLVYDTHGALVRAEPGSEFLAPLVSQHIVPTLPKGSDLATLAPAGAAFATSQGLVAVGYGPITRTDGSGPARGLYVIGAPLTPDLAQKLQPAGVQGLAFVPRDGAAEQDTYAPRALAEFAQGHGGPLVHFASEAVGHAYLPLQDPTGDVIGVLTVTLDRGGLREVQRFLRRWTLIAAVVILVATVTFGGLVGRSLIRPVRRLQAAVERIVHTWRLTEQVEVGTRDEIGALAQAFNHMAARLRATLVSKRYADGILRS